MLFQAKEKSSRTKSARVDSFTRRRARDCIEMWQLSRAMSERPKCFKVCRRLSFGEVIGETKVDGGRCYMLAQATRQLPDQSTTLSVKPSSTGDARCRGAPSEMD